MGTLNQPSKAPAELVPPKWAERFFRWYCNEDLQEELLGDFYEQFCDRWETAGPQKAKLGYWLNVITFINKYTLRRKRGSFTHIITPDMFRNYFKLGLRNILKNKLSSFINVFGLALAIGCCLVVYRFIIQFYYPDSFHGKLDNIFVAERLVNEDGRRQLWGAIPEPLGPAIQGSSPQVVNFCRLKNYNANFKKGEQIFTEWITFADSSFCDLFDFPVKWGNENNFFARNAIVLSQDASEKYFGNDNPVGQEVHLRFNIRGEIKERMYVVQGVMEDIPDDSSFRFNILLPFSAQKGLYVENFNDWTRYSNTLFLELTSPNQVEQVQSAASPFLAQYNEANSGWPTEKLHLEPLSGMFRHSYMVNDSPFISAHIAALFMLLIIGGALLTLACFNYMNIAVASATKRLREIGVRKVMGGNRAQLVIQFLTENLVLCVFSVLLGFLLARMVFLPWFNNMSDIAMDLSFQKHPSLWIFLVGLIIITTIGAAGYPAFYLASFRPIAVLKNKIRFSSKNRFRKVLLGTQFLLSFLSIFAAIMFLNVSKEVQNRTWGYNQKGIIDIRLNYSEDYETLKNEIQQISGVERITGARTNAGVWSEKVVAEISDQEYSVMGLSVGYDYLETMEIDLINGRLFDRQKPNDLKSTIIINEQFQKRLGWEDPIDKKITIDSQSYLVIGKIKNFHHEPFDNEVKPMVIRLAKPQNFRHLIVRVPEDEVVSTAQAISGIWKRHYPDSPYDHRYQDDAFNGYFNAFEQVNQVFKATAFLTIIISSIGLFGLAMLILSRKMKELSIRKVLGASLIDISYNINKEFLSTIIIASVIGIPLGYFMLDTLISLIYPEVQLGFLPFLLTFIFLIVMTLISVSRHIYVAMVSDPSRYLKDE